MSLLILFQGAEQGAVVPTTPDEGNKTLIERMERRVSIQRIEVRSSVNRDERRETVDR